LAYGLVIFLVKVCHELGHAFTAKRFGCRVPAMGIAFLVMWPVAYTDTNETWRLTNRYERLQVACAGIFTELTIAAWASAAWALLPEGGVRSAAFVLATTSWVATLAINASPFMRFDGYFIVCDSLDFPNLHGRSFALARWKLREWLFGLNEAAPEFFSTEKTALLIVFALLTWLYRLVLFLGIAALVYFYFFKLLGVALFLVEIVWFVAWPIRSELLVWKERWSAIKQQKRSVKTLKISLVLLTVLLLPWPGRVGVSAILRPADTWPVFAPSGSQLNALPYKEGDLVESGAVVVSLNVPDLEMRRVTSEAKLEQQRWQAASSGLDTEMQRRLLVNEESFQAAKIELNGLLSEQALYQPKAPFSGYLRDLDPDLKEGQWLSKREKIGLLVKKDTDWIAETWLDEDSVQRIQVGDSASFVTEGVGSHRVALRVSSIDKDATRVLPRNELAAQWGGHLMTREKNGQMLPERAVYRVVFSAHEIPPMLVLQSWRGHVVVNASCESPAWRYLRQTLVVMVRELGF
jgi:putative peptide zinc metalloprotease protein